MKPDFLITEFGLELSFKEPKDILQDFVNQLSHSNFQFKTVSEMQLRFQKVRELLPRIALSANANKYRLFVFNDNISLSISPNAPTSDEDKEKQIEKIFDKEELSKINADINYIFGTIAGILRLSKFTITVNMAVESKDTKFNFDHLLTKNLEIKNSLQTTMTGIQLQFLQQLLGGSVNVIYEFRNTEDVAEGNMSFKHDVTLPVQIDKMIYELKENFNSTYQQVSKQ